MEQKQLETIIENAYKSGYMKCLEFIRKMPNISKREAEKIYGFKKIRYWIEHNEIKPIHSGREKNSTIMFSMFDLEMLDQREELRVVNLKS